MAKQVKITVTGIKETKRFLRKKNKEAEDLTKKGVTKAAIFVQGEVKSSIAGQRAETRSVDTGRLLNSVDIKVSEDDAAIFTGLPYGPFIEYGTSRFTGRRHFRNTANRSKPKVKNIIQKEIDKI